jgi:uncharacterized hydrophobic protein (TIGR00271 family)
MTTLFKSLTEKDKADAVEKLISDSSPNEHFFLMIILSVCMATFGLISNNASVVIGSMLIAPLLSPILSLAMGVVMADSKLVSRSAVTTLKAGGFAIITAAIVTLFFSPIIGLGSGVNSEILSRLNPDIIAASVAIISGLAASFALIKPQLNAALPGVAVSVALIPPLSVAGIGLARLDWEIIAKANMLFLINAACIVFASAFVFSMMRFYTKRSLAEHAVKAEDKKLEQEKELADKKSE